MHVQVQHGAILPHDFPGGRTDEQACALAAGAIQLERARAPGSEHSPPQRLHCTASASNDAHGHGRAEMPDACSVWHGIRSTAESRRAAQSCGRRVAGTGHRCPLLCSGDLNLNGPGSARWWPLHCRCVAVARAQCRAASIFFAT